MPDEWAGVRHDWERKARLSSIFSPSGVVASTADWALSGAMMRAALALWDAER
jgi:hypothetical protein